MSAYFWKMRLIGMYPHLFVESKSKNIKGEDDDADSSGEPGCSYCPLSNELILKNIFSHLTYKEQLQCRSVCRQWNDLITTSYRRHHQEMKTITNEIDLRKLNAAFKNATGLLPVSNFQVFLNEMRRPQFDFLQNSALHWNIVDLKIVVASYLVPALLTCLVNFSGLRSLTIVRIPEDTFESIYVARDINFGVTEFSGFPHKTKLKFLEKVVFEKWAPTRKLLFSYAYVVNAFIRRIPNLKILVFDDWSGSFYQMFCNFHFEHLEELTVTGRCLGHDEITFLISKGLPKLQKLVMTAAPTVSCSLVKELLQSMKGTLKEQKVFHSKHKHKA